MKSVVAALTAAVAALCATAAEYDATRYGAKPDGATDSTAAIQKAIDDCAAKGGGRVLVPGGGKYVTYTLNLKSNVELHVERGATLLGGEDPLKYPVFETNAVWNAERSPRFNRRAMFYTVGQTNVAITGAGTISPFKNISPYLLSRDLPAMVFTTVLIGVFGLNYRSPREPKAIGRAVGVLWLLLFAAYMALMLVQETK